MAWVALHTDGSARQGQAVIPVEPPGYCDMTGDGIKYRSAETLDAPQEAECAISVDQAGRAAAEILTAGRRPEVVAWKSRRTDSATPVRDPDPPKVTALAWRLSSRAVGG